MELDTILPLIAAYAVPALLALLILWIGFRIARVISEKFETIFNKAPNSDPGLSRFFASIIKFVFMVIVAMAALSVMGVDTSSAFGIIAASGAALAFILQGTLSNISAGVMLILFKPYKIGDEVEVGGEKGKVEDIALTATRLSTADRIEVIVGNRKVRSGVIKNYTSMGVRRLDRDFGIGYDADIDDAIKVITDAAATNPSVHATPAPWAKVVNLGDSSVDIQLRIWCDAADYKALSTEISQPVKEALDAAGINIPYPHEIKIKQRVKTSKARDRVARLTALREQNS